MATSMTASGRPPANSPTTLVQIAEARLRADILSGVVAPHQKLRVEELKTRYDMGASPVREALSRLVGEGLVTFEGNKGFRVTGLSRADLADIADMRTAIETHGVRRAIKRGDAEWEAGILAALHRLVRATERTASDDGAGLDAWTAAHDGFHFALVSACGSERVFEFQRRLAEQHNRYRRILMGANIPRAVVIAEHRALAEAVLDRDAARATELLRRHMWITYEFYGRVLAGEAEPARTDIAALIPATPPPTQMA